MQKLQFYTIRGTTGEYNFVIMTVIYVDCMNINIVKITTNEVILGRDKKFI